MAETRFHGARTKEETDLITAINNIDSSVIGLVAVADDADEDTFPLNTPTLITRVQSVLGKAGTPGGVHAQYNHKAHQRHSKRLTLY